jgi:hypothetical protein
MRTSALLLILAAFSCDAFAADSARFENGLAKTAKRDQKGNAISVSVYATEYPKNFAFGSGYRWGTETRPQSIITKIEITVGKDTLFVPLSAYADLANPTSILLDTSGKAFRLFITGGDASAAYEAILIFSRASVSKRRVANQVFPDSAWEQTTYSYTH